MYVTQNYINLAWGLQGFPGEPNRTSGGFTMSFLEFLAFIL